MGGNIIVSDDAPAEQSQHQPERPDRPSSVDASHIPAPRFALDDQPDLHIPSQRPPQHDGDVSSENGAAEPEFQYDQIWKRGKRRRYNGFVDRVGGPEGERLREDLAAAVRDLLDWAARENTHSTTDNADSESGAGEGPVSEGGGRS